ncbi:MAG TPA: 2-oxoacid:acceptor oxidoreductase family protein [Thermodesulfobacteriota bacterium]|nr:2-oxoacid:acceptor oxidoreductase family protein [Thermodesulfobacteriota bacterium]
MKKDYRIRIHSIGGEGGVGASEILAEAIGTLTSFQILQTPFFGTERSGAPAITYLSFSMGPIKERGTIEHPNGIVIFNTKLFTVAPSLLNGFENRDGKLIVNTDEDPSSL